MSNYELMKNKMAKEFVSYDQTAMVRKFHLNYDEKYLYIEFISRPYRIGRTNGLVEWSDDGFAHAHEAEHNDAMTIYDVLCCSEPNCTLAGEFVSLQSLSSIQGSSGTMGSSFFDNYTREFESKTEKLTAACERLHGTPFPKGDIAYEIPLFSFFPAVFRFWNPDDEFSANLQVLFDRNALQFMHYESLWFAASHLLKRLQEEMDD